MAQLPLMATINWELTIDTIQSGKCILFLGPEVFTNAEGEHLASTGKNRKIEALEI